MNVARNTISNVVLSLSKGLAGLFLIPFFVAQVGKENYAIIVLILGIIGYAYIFDLGLKQALVRNLSAEKQEEHEENELFATALAGSLLYFLASFIFLLLVMVLFGRSFGIPDAVLHSSAIYIFIFLYLLVNIISPVFSALLLSKNRFDLVNYRASFFSLLGIGLTILLVWLTDLSYYAWMLAALVSKILELLVLLVLVKKYFPHLEIHVRHYRRSRLGSLLSFGWKMLISKWNRKIKFDSDPLIISYFMGPVAVALYRPGAALVQSIRPIVSSMAGQLFVSASKAHRDENKKALRALLFFGSKFTVLAYLPVFFLLLFLGDWIIELWLGRVYQAEDLRLIFRVMVLWSLIDLFFYLEGSSYSVLFGIDQLDFMIKADFMISLLNIAASVVLIKYFNAGLTGVLIPGVCIELFARIGFFINTAKRIGITLKECLMEYFIPLFLAFVLVFVPLWLVHLQHFTPWIRISSVVVILALFYPMLCWKLALNHEERTLLSSRLRKFLPFLS